MTHPTTTGARGAGPKPPLWRQVLDDLRDRIATGDIGDRFPTDRELVERYGVSRHTVREAVRHLKAQGIIERERGRGSFVRQVDVAQQMGTLFSLFREVEARGMSQDSEVLALDWQRDDRAARELGVTADTPLVRLARVRHADGVPLALDTIWLPGDIGAAILDVDFAHTALYDELDRLLGLRMDAGTETIGAVAATPDVADVLELDEGEALLRVVRIGRVDGRAVECRITLVRGSRFALVQELSATVSGPGRTVAVDQPPVATGPV